MGNNRRAFTLIEILVVLGITAVMSGLALTYTSIGRNEIALTIEASKVSQFILEAKELSISTYTAGSASCGFGFVINANAKPQTYSIFAYSPSSTCPSAENITGLTPATDEQQYTPGTWNIPVSNGVVIESSSDSLAAVLFYPPEPTVFLSYDGTTFQPATAKVYLKTSDGSNSLTVAVNPEGQVSF